MTKILKTNRETGAETVINLNPNLDRFPLKFALAIYIFFFEHGNQASLAEWLHGLSMGIDEFIKTEAFDRIFSKIKTSGNMPIYTNDHFIYVIES